MGAGQPHLIMYAIIITVIAAIQLVSADIGLDYKYGIASEASHGVPYLKFGKNYGFSHDGFEHNLQGNIRGFTHVNEQSSYYPPPIPSPTPPSVYFIGTSTPSSIYQQNGGQLYASGESSNVLENQRIVAIPRPQFNGGVYHQQQTYHASHSNPYQTLNQHQSYINEKYQTQYNQVQQPTQVFKHFYVHVAPEEPEPPKRQQTITLPPPQKHYKIIFIKAPSVAASAPQIIPVPQQNEEKTIVYVLVKKPEENNVVNLPKFEAKPPAKPEVFFIKYNNKDESQAVINNIVNDYSKVDTVTFAGPPGTGQYLGTQTGVSSQKFPKTGQYAQSSDAIKYVSSVDTSKYETETEQLDHNSLPATSQASTAAQYTGSTYTGSIGLANKFGEEASNSQSSLNLGQINKATSSVVVNESTGDQKLASPDVVASSTESVQLQTANGAGGQFDNTFSLTQHVPHETYGPPKFRQ